MPKTLGWWTCSKCDERQSDERSRAKDGTRCKACGDERVRFDVERLEALVGRIEVAKADLESLYAERRRIWFRHLDRGDVTQRELSRRSQVRTSVVTQEWSKSG